MSQEKLRGDIKDCIKTWEKQILVHVNNEAKIYAPLPAGEGLTEIAVFIDIFVLGGRIKFISFSTTPRSANMPTLKRNIKWDGDNNYVKKKNLMFYFSLVQKWVSLAQIKKRAPPSQRLSPDWTVLQRRHKIQCWKISLEYLPKNWGRAQTILILQPKICLISPIVWILMI